MAIAGPALVWYAVLILDDVLLGLVVIVLRVGDVFRDIEVPGISGSGIADAGVILIRLVLLKPRWFNYIIRTRNRLDPSFIGMGSSFSPRPACGIKFNGCTLYFT